MQQDLLIRLNFISYGGVHYVKVAACLYSSTLACKCYHHIGIKTSTAIRQLRHLPNAWSLPEWKSFRRLRSPLSISWTSDTSVRKECWIGAACAPFVSPPGGLAFSFITLEKNKQTKNITSCFHFPWESECKISVHLGIENEMENKYYMFQLLHLSLKYRSPVCLKAKEQHHYLDSLIL